MGRGAPGDWAGIPARQGLHPPITAGAPPDSRESLTGAVPARLQGDGGGGGGGWIKQMRVLRAFRLFRLFGKMGQLKRIVTAVVLSIVPTLQALVGAMG